MRDYFTDPAVRAVAHGQAERVDRPLRSTTPRCITCGQSPCVETPHEDDDA